MYRPRRDPVWRVAGLLETMATILAHHLCLSDRWICRKRMNITSPTHEGHGEGLSLTGEATGASDLDAAREQRWNECQLAEPVLQPRMKVWTYREGAIVLGRSQHALADRPAGAEMRGTPIGDAGGSSPDDLADSGAGRLPLVKRGAGGGAVLVGPWLLSASLLLPLDDPRMATTSVADSYRWLGEAMVETLAELGVTARAVPPAERIPALERLAWACFAGVAPWEGVVDDPTTGVARSRHGVLLALGVLVQPAPWRLLAQTLGHPVALADELAATTVDLASVSPRPVSNDDFLAALWPRLQPMSLMTD